MSCDVSSSPFSDHGISNGSPFGDEPHPNNDQVDLSAIADFNTNFQGFSQDAADPHANFSSASSPGFGLDQTLSPDPSANFYPDFGSTPSSPYFQSIEPAPSPLMPSPLRNQYLHRRSVSEPPTDAMLHHHRSNQEQQVTFHRDGHKLGAPNLKSSAYAPPAKRAKQSRAQSYRSSHHGPPPTAQDRYHLRRTHTQPTNRGPTSSPMGMSMLPPHPPHPPHHTMLVPFDPMQGDQQFVSSRVCTPALEAVDPVLAVSQAPMMPQMGAGPLPHSRAPPTVPKALVIKMGVDELKVLIQEAVQKAVEGLQAGKSMGKPITETDEADDMVVAGKAASAEGDSKVDEGHIMEE